VAEITSLRCAEVPRINSPFMFVHLQFFRASRDTHPQKPHDIEMSDNNGIDERIRLFILKKFPAAKKQGLNDELPLLETGIFDSLGVLDVVQFLEETFHITIGDDELMPENFTNVRRIAAFVLRKTRADQPAQRM